MTHASGYVNKPSLTGIQLAFQIYRNASHAVDNQLISLNFSFGCKYTSVPFRTDIIMLIKKMVISSLLKTEATFPI